uniref:NADP-retinol dehydrogenase n=1 Tax=Callorhinchus milii TaxID=7868 RepID=A0A4W3IB81_CALMI|eukprot:gi/632978261/ref/XP_007905810.1/ PREDICTED: retinol dehydrogenase 12-like isoform X1 [Callorhinchus milii]
MGTFAKYLYKEEGGKGKKKRVIIVNQGNKKTCETDHRINLAPVTVLLSIQEKVAVNFVSMLKSQRWITVVIQTLGSTEKGTFVRKYFSECSIPSKASSPTGRSSDIRLDGKTVLLTGGNTGIGKETARDLAKRGARIIIACRDMEKGTAAVKELVEDSGNESIIVKKLDLADTKSIREFAAQINDGEEQINILINNAGVMMCPYSKTADGFEMQFGVNHLGHFLLTYLLLDLVKRSSPARIINVSSTAHKMGSINFKDLNSEQSYSSIKAYGQSKLANILFTKELAKKLEGTGVTVYSLHPGAVRTELGRHLNVVIRASFKLFHFFTKSPTEGAQTSIYCAVAPELETKTGQYYSDCAQVDCSRAASNEETAKKLWDVSCKMVGIDWQ